LIKKIRGTERNALLRIMFDKNFYDNYRSIVVLANPKTILNARYAKKEVRNQVIRADQLAEFIRKVDAEPDASACSEKTMENLAQFFVSIHKQPKIDYTEKFRAMVEDADSNTPDANPTVEAPSEPPVKSNAEVVVCPKCGTPMVLRKAVKGPKAGIEFYGYSSFPKCRGVVNI
jgi:hypothetical protein